MPLTNVKVSASEEPLSNAPYETGLANALFAKKTKI